MKMRRIVKSSKNYAFGKLNKNNKTFTHRTEASPVNLQKMWTMYIEHLTMETLKYKTQKVVV